jgi:hypothetical protein
MTAEPEQSILVAQVQPLAVSVLLESRMNGQDVQSVVDARSSSTDSLVI